MNENENIFLNEVDAHEIFSEDEEEYDASGLVSNSTKLYIQQISEIPLLTFDQEKKLAMEIAAGSNEALHSLVEHNLRLVVSIAKKYCGCGLSFLDLIQEGNIGLMTAAKRYDVSRGFRFSTYATWWVRQAISRALSNQSRAIRVPANIAELIGKMKKVSAQMAQNLGRMPTEEELAAELGVDVDKVKVAADMSHAMVSLDTPIGEEDDVSIGELIADHAAENPLDNLFEEANKEIIANVFRTLPAKEAHVLRMRFGIGEEKAHTLEEVGQNMGVSRERIRQIETKALRKLRNPMRTKMLQEAL